MDNNTIDSNSTDTDSNSTFVGDGAHIAYTYIDYVVLCFTILVFVIGTVSWCTIKKFRHFKNYVFISAILSGALNDIVAALYIGYRFNYSQYVSTYTFLRLRMLYHATITYFSLVKYFWMLVLCWIFYVDIVKVFGGDISRRYFKSSLFSWGIPVILSFPLPLILLALSNYIEIETTVMICAFFDLAILFLPLLISFGVYVKVICTLFKSSDVSRTAVKNRRIYLATLIFLLSGVLFFIMPLWFIVDLPYFILFIIKHLQTMTMNVYLLIVKSNRDLWMEYYEKRKNKTNVNREGHRLNRLNK